MRLLLASLLSLGALSFAIIASAFAQTQNASAPSGEKPEVIAIKFHADWCGSCRRMGSVFEDLTTVAEDEPVLFVRLDLTDRSSRKQARFLMTMLNLQSVWQQAGAGDKTGFIVLMDADTRQALGQLTADHDLKQMKAALLDVVAKIQS